MGLETHLPIAIGNQLQSKIKFSPMKKHFLFLLFAITLLSCNSQSDFEKKLVKSKWVYHEGKTLTDEIDRWPIDYYTFTEGGLFKCFWISSGEEREGVNDDGSANNDPIFWSYDSDKEELIINNLKHKMLSIEGDTIRLKRDTTNIMFYNIDKTQVKLKKGPGRCLGG